MWSTASGGRCVPRLDDIDGSNYWGSVPKEECEKFPNHYFESNGSRCFYCAGNFNPTTGVCDTTTCQSNKLYDKVIYGLDEATCAQCGGTYQLLHSSDGGFVGDLGLGGKVQFNRIKASHTGEYILTIYYISKDTRPAKLLVNNVQIGDTIFFQSNGDCTSSWSPDGMGWKMIPVTLNEGSKNTVTIQAFDDLWAPNFDRITIHPVLSDEEITGIEAPTNRAHEAYMPYETYDLDGRKLAGIPSKGIYISEGKKFLVK